jgi:type VI secretion system secreted protein Hcp
MSRLWLTLALSLLVVVGFAQPQSAEAQNVKMFLQVSGINGPSTDSQHKGWIDVLSYGQGVSTASTTTPADFQPLKVLKHVDDTSPALLLDAAQGDHLEQVQLDVVRSDGLVLLNIVLYDAVVGSVSSTSDSDHPLLELVTFFFGKIRITATIINPDGTSGGTTTFSWDLQTRKPLP